MPFHPGHEKELLIETLEDQPQELFQPVTLVTSFGNVACRFYAAQTSRRGAIWVGGVGGGFDTPAHGLYPRLCEELMDEGLSSLRVRFRHPTDLAESVLDVRTGLEFLINKGIGPIALIGHSFGGAVVIQAALRTLEVRTVITLATQSFGAEPVPLLGPRCSMLLIHGMEDTVLPYRSSLYVHGMAKDPKKLVLYPAAGHMLDEVADEVDDEVRRWIKKYVNE